MSKILKNTEEKKKDQQPQPEKKALAGFSFTILEGGDYDIRHMGVANDLELLALVEMCKAAVLAKVVEIVSKDTKGD